MKSREQLGVMKGPTTGLGVRLSEEAGAEGECIWRKLRRLRRLMVSPFLSFLSLFLGKG